MNKLVKRPGKSPLELGITDNSPECPDIWMDENGDFIIIGKDITDTVDMNGKDASVKSDEKVVLIPRVLLLSAAKGLIKTGEI